MYIIVNYNAIKRAASIMMPPFWQAQGFYDLNCHFRRFALKNRAVPKDYGEQQTIVPESRKGVLF